jgi:hypothetical protein
VILQIVFIMASMDDDILAAVGCVIVWGRFRKKRRKSMAQGVAFEEKRAYSHKNLITELEFFLKDFHNYLRTDHDTYVHLLSLVTPFITKEDMLMTTHTSSKRLGKSGLKAEKELIFVTSRHTRWGIPLGPFRPNLEEILLVYGYL